MATTKKEAIPIEVKAKAFIKDLEELYIKHGIIGHVIRPKFSSQPDKYGDFGIGIDEALIFDGKEFGQDKPIEIHIKR